MIERLLAAPIGFWVVIGVLALLTIEGVANWKAPWAKPALVVYGTIAVWYPGDFILSDSREFARFDPTVVEFALFQVAAFLLIVRLLAPWIAKKFCNGLRNVEIQGEVPNRILGQVLLVVSLFWLGMFLVAAVRSEGKWLALLWPPVEPVKVGMFVHPGVGSGGAFLIAAAGYIHILVCALFGPIAVLGRGRIRLLAIAMIAITWPYFFFDRIRNAMLALILPAVACYWTFNRQRILWKVVVSAVLLLAVSIWFSRVMAYRGAGNMDLRIINLFQEGKSATLGLDMMKELCWINTFIESGHYQVNWGERYFSEMVNFVPRTFWPEKPMAGIDYAIARGFRGTGGKLVNATISTGMIGEGVVNFGPYLGVLAAATLISIWIALLARLWMQRASLPRLLLYLLGLGLTFNMGRDITLLVLFPFVFGYIGVWVFENLWSAPSRKAMATNNGRSRKRPLVTK